MFKVSVLGMKFATLAYSNDSSSQANDWHMFLHKCHQLK